MVMQVLYFIQLKSPALVRSIRHVRVVLKKREGRLANCSALFISHFRIVSLVDRGLPDHWMDLSLPERKQCSPSKQKIFKVDILFMALVVSGIGVTTATVILVMEKCGVGHCY